MGGKMDLKEGTFMDLLLLVITGLLLFHIFVQGADQYGRGFRDCNDKWQGLISDNRVKK
jgi:type IV secretory pathway TrbL component